MSLHFRRATLKLAGLSFVFAALSSAAPVVSILRCTSTIVAPGTSDVCTVYLTAPAPSTGVTVALAARGIGVTVPPSVKVGPSAMAAHFTASISSSAPPQTAAISATTGATTLSTSLTVTGAGAAYQVTSFSCSPSTIIPAASANCMVYLSADAPAAGLVASVSSSSPNLSVPASVNIPATASIFQFSTTASAQASVAETVTLTVTVSSSTASTKVAINPYAAFSLAGDTSEINSLANGATVRPSAAPSNWLGTLTERGSGYLGMTNVSNGDGIMFHNGGPQNANAAFINFSGQNVGQVFHNQGEVKFLLKSSYSFAQRQGLPQLNARFAFDVYDAAGPQFAFYTYTSAGRLRFAYTTNGITGVYTVPAGQEDALFGAGVVANIRITWTSTSNTLYVNGQAVRTGNYSPVMPNWSSTSALTIGSDSARVGSGGYYASDDGIANFQVR